MKLNEVILLSVSPWKVWELDRTRNMSNLNFDLKCDLESDMAESWVLHIMLLGRIFVPSFIKIPSHIANLWSLHYLTVTLTYDLDIRLTWLESWVVHIVSMRRIFLPCLPNFIVSMRIFAPSFIKIPSGIAKLWSWHYIIVPLICDLDIRQPWLESCILHIVSMRTFVPSFNCDLDL